MRRRGLGLDLRMSILESVFPGRLLSLQMDLPFEQLQMFSASWESLSPLRQGCGVQ